MDNSYETTKQAFDAYNQKKQNMIHEQKQEKINKENKIKKKELKEQQYSEEQIKENKKRQKIIYESNISIKLVDLCVDSLEHDSEIQNQVLIKIADEGNKNVEIV